MQSKDFKWNKYRSQITTQVKDLDNKNSEGANWVSLFIDRNTAIYFDFFGIEYIPLEVWNKIRDKSFTHNIFRIPDNKSIMCGYIVILS